MQLEIRLFRGGPIAPLLYTWQYACVENGLSEHTRFAPENCPVENGVAVLGLDFAVHTSPTWEKPDPVPHPTDKDPELQPPHGHETWLDFALSTDHPIVPTFILRARAELDVLRAAVADKASGDQT